VTEMTPASSDRRDTMSLGVVPEVKLCDLQAAAEMLSASDIETIVSETRDVEFAQDALELARDQLSVGNAHRALRWLRVAVEMDVPGADALLREVSARIDGTPPVVDGGASPLRVSGEELDFAWMQQVRRISSWIDEGLNEQQRRVQAVALLAQDDWLATSDVKAMKHTMEDARLADAGSVVQMISLTLLVDKVLRGDFREAEKLVEAVKRAAIQLGLRHHMRDAVVAEATLAAHEGARSRMETVLAKLPQWDTDDSQAFPVRLGLARAVCALLEENRMGAHKELNEEPGMAPSVFNDLSGHYGLNLFLSVLDGEAGWRDHELAASKLQASMRWNRQFILLAKAVLLGRDGKAADANEVVVTAQQDQQLYPLAYHLGLRLTAEAAIADGWGTPVAWLRRAEEYFHQRSIPAVAGACRSLLRHAGAPVRSRRTGIDGVPEDLRAIGVTVREHEVLQLLVERLTNKAIANRLHISPRTVEKHVASLIIKTDVTDRVELSELAGSSCTDPSTNIGPGTESAKQGYMEF
jgi:DNA-binding CsgD family transcriptional regulator